MASEAANAERQAKAQNRVDAQVERIAKSLNFAAPPRTRADTRDGRNANEIERMATFLELVANHVDPNAAAHKAGQAPAELGGIGEYREQDEQQRQAAEQQRLERQAGGAAGPAPEGAADADTSPLSEKNADEAIDQISRMRSPDKLQHVIDNDKRATVKAAAEQRLAELQQ